MHVYRLNRCSNGWPLYIWPLSMQAPYILKSSSSEVTWLSLLLAHYQARHVTALHTSQSLSQYGNLPLAKIRGPSAETFWKVATILCLSSKRIWDLNEFHHVRRFLTTTACFFTTTYCSHLSVDDISTTHICGSTELWHINLKNDYCMYPCLWALCIFYISKYLTSLTVKYSLTTCICISINCLGWIINMLTLKCYYLLFCCTLQCISITVFFWSIQSNHCEWWKKTTHYFVLSV